MNEQTVVALGTRAMLVTLYIAGPVLGFGLVTGVAISLVQAVTQIQEMTLTFIPKIIAVMVAIVVFGPWMMRIMTTFTTDLFTMIPQLAR